MESSKVTRSAIHLDSERTTKDEEKKRTFVAVRIQVDIQNKTNIWHASHQGNQNNGLWKLEGSFVCNCTFVRNPTGAEGIELNAQRSLNKPSHLSTRLLAALETVRSRVSLL